MLLAGLFPVVHIMGGDGAWWRGTPGLPASAFRTFRCARDIVVTRLDNTNALATSLPLQIEEAARAHALMDTDVRPYTPGRIA